MPAQFGVAYTSAVTRNRVTAQFSTKAGAIKAAKALFIEGARNIQTFKFVPGLGAVDFDWRKGGR